MPEFAPPKPPETKYEVKAEDFIKAVKGNSFVKGKGLYRLSGREIIEKKLFGDEYFFTDEYEEEFMFVVLKEARIIDASQLTLINEIKTSYDLGFIFYKSIIPGVVLKNAITTSWHFQNTYLYGSISFEDSESGDIHIDGNSRSGNISFDKNSQILSISIENNSRCGIIKFDNNSLSDGIYVVNCSQCETIYIDNNSQSDDITIEDDSQSGNISIYRNSRCTYILINRNSRSGEIGIYSNSQSNCISVSHGSQCEEIKIYVNSKSDTIYIEDSSVARIDIQANFSSFALINAHVPQMRIKDSKLGFFAWEAGTTGELYIDNCQINHVGFDNTTLQKDAIISVSDTSVMFFTMEKLLVQGQLLLRRVMAAPGLLKWSDIEAENSGGAKDETGNQILPFTKSLLPREHKEYFECEYSKVVERYGDRPLFRVVHSSLGKTEIAGSNLEDFNFEYFNSKILDCFITGTRLPKDKINIYNDNPKQKLSGKDYFEQKTSIYNQFKKIFENQGDVVESAWYHSKAMENQERLLYLQYKNSGGKGLKKWFSEERFNLFNFKLNQLSNNHGESWRRALRFIFLTSLAVYSLYYLFLHYHESFSFNATARYLRDYFGFLDPTHKIDFHVAKEEIGVLPIICDFLGRIIIGYGIYQLIAAFRRHGRKIA